MRKKEGEKASFHRKRIRRRSISRCRKSALDLQSIENRSLKLSQTPEILIIVSSNSAYAYDACVSVNTKLSDSQAEELIRVKSGASVVS